MVSLLKSFFGPRELTDKELYAEYKKSQKTVKDFEKYIMNIKEGKEVIALKEIPEIKISNIEDIDILIDILEQHNINKGISLTTNKFKKKLNEIYNQLKKISHIHKNYLKDNDLINFIYSNKFELFNYLRKNYEKKKDASFLNFIYNEYFNQQNYLGLLEYFLVKDSENNIKFLLPNQDNYIQIKTKNAIPIYVNLSDIYYKLEKEKDITNEINNLLLNIIIYFYSNHNEDHQVCKNLNKYIPSQNTEYIDIVLNLYTLAKKTDPTLTLEKFVKNPNLVKVFKKMYSCDYKTFTYVFNNIMSNVKEYSNIYKGLKNLPLEIIREMIISKAKYDYITKGIDIIINSNEYNNTAVFNFILKYLFDYYCFDRMSLNQLSKIINFLSKYNSNYNEITNQIDSLIEVIEIFESKKTDFLINELINDDKNDMSANNKYIIALIDYLNNIAESKIQYNEYDFIDQNIIEINKLLSYKKGLKLGKLLFYYFEKYQDKRPLILNILISNNNIILNEKELQSLIELYLLNPYLIKIESYNIIEKFLDEPIYPLTSDTVNNLENLLEYLKIKKYIQKYNIDDSVFKDYSLDNYSENIPEIAKLLLIKTTNLDSIPNIKTFLNSDKSKDIKDSLRIKNNKYLFYLFNILIEHKKILLANEVLDLLLKDEDTQYFNKCMDYLYNNYCKKNNEQFKNYCKNAKIEDYLLENNNKYLDILIDNNDFMKDEKIAFPVEKQPNDLLLLYSLIKNNKIKNDKNKNMNDLFISYDQFNKLPIENRNFKNLIDCYYKNKEDDMGNKINYNYSLHPKLIEILKAKKYFHLFQDLKITFKAKINIYNFCIKNKICTLNDIINNFETIKIKQKAKTDEEIVGKFKLLFNLYKEKDENNPIYKELFNFIKANYDNEQNKKNALLLIDFNLSNKLFISYDNLLFLNYFFGYNIKSSDENELKLLQLLFNSNNKINILPFCSDFNDNFINNKYYQFIFEKYYKNNLFICLKENNSYFEEIKTQYISTNPNIYYQSLELFNIFNIGNMHNIKNICKYLYEKKKDKINIDFLFAFKMTINFLTINCCIPNRIKYGLNNLFGIFNSLDLNINEINKLLKEIFFFQSISYINNSNHNILLFNEEHQKLVKNFLEAKMSLVEGIINMYYNEKINNSLVFSAYKIFLIKVAVIKRMPKDEISNMYNAIKDLNHFNEIKEEIKDYKSLIDEIYNIYSQ